METRKIKRNAIRCLKCDTVIESLHRHHWVQCPCGSSFVDGGVDYVRFGGNLEEVEILTEYFEEDDEEVKPL